MWSGHPGIVLVVRQPAGDVGVGDAVRVAWMPEAAMSLPAD